jgi:PPOX class probable F420-dependent enzyme
VNAAEARRRFAAGRVAVLGTVGARGTPHLVPVTFVVAGEELWTAVDGKPKRGSSLARIDNVRANPWVSLLVQSWDEDWSALWWVRADGRARVAERDDEVVRATALLRAKYRQYEAVAVTGPAIVVPITAWRWWAAEA